tara:strand:+ start:3652 stop:3849 length:198 start_codon:yes stop_codon:yes gene_type:complete
MLGTKWKNRHVKTIVEIVEVITEKEPMQYKENVTVFVVKNIQGSYTTKWEENYFLQHHMPLEEEE